MNWLSRLRNLVSRRSQAITLADFWGSHAHDWGRMGLSGVRVSEHTALSLTAAFAARNVISTDVACLPFRMYQRRPGGGRDQVTSHPLAYRLSVTPDGETTPMNWTQSYVDHCLGWGNGYAEIDWDNAGQVAGLYLLNPDCTRAERRPQDKKLFYRTEGNRTLPPYKVLHLAGLGFDGLSGYSPIRMAREAVGLGLAAEAFGATYFGNGTTPKGVLQTPNKLNDTAIKNLRDSWNNIHRGPGNAHKPAILEQGLEWKNMSVPLEDAQFLATRQFQVIEIARLYRLPPHKIGDYSQAHMTNVEAANLDYVITVLAPWCERIEQVYNLKLLTDADRARGLYVEHVMTAILRGDMKARAEFYAKLLSLGVFSPNDICDRENLNPIGPDGDRRYISVQVVPIEKAGDDTRQPSSGQDAAGQDASAEGDNANAA